MTDRTIFAPTGTSEELILRAAAAMGLVIYVIENVDYYPGFGVAIDFLGPAEADMTSLVQEFSRISGIEVRPDTDLDYMGEPLAS